MSKLKTAPLKPSRFLLWFAMLIYGRKFAKKNFTVTKNIPKHIKPPFIVLVNHLSIQDFKICAATLYPILGNYIAAYNQFIGREKFLRKLGAHPKRQFSTDISIVRDMMQVFKRKGVVVIFPEAKLSVDGTCGILTPAIAKLIKLSAVPVLNLSICGSYIDKPKWAKCKRGGAIISNLGLLLDEPQIKEMSVEEIFDKVKSTMQYDDFKWQRENKIKTSCTRLTEGLHHILYQCPNCLAEGSITSQLNALNCTRCGKNWKMDEYGVLKALSGKTEYDNVHDWYEFQRINVSKEIIDGLYNYASECDIKLLPNFKGYIDGGSGKITHDLDGFKYKGKCNNKPVEFSFPSQAIYTLPFECGQSWDLATETQTYRICPKETKLITKTVLAAEEIYKLKTYKNK